MTATPLTAIRQSDGQMYLREQNPFEQYNQFCIAQDIEYYESKDYLDFDRTHPPVIVLFKCEEGQSFVEGVDVVRVWQTLHPTQNKWYDEKPDLYQYFKDYEEYRARHENEGGIKTRPAFQLIEKERGKEAETGFKGTPGKWFYQANADAYTHIVRPELKPGMIISHLSQDTSGVAEADARLIAAAPELMEALQGLLSFCKSHQMDNHYTEQAKSAINKALNKKP